MVDGEKRNWVCLQLVDDEVTRGVHELLIVDCERRVADDRQQTSVCFLQSQPYVVYMHCDTHNVLEHAEWVACVRPKCCSHELLAKLTRNINTSFIGNSMFMWIHMTMPK